MKQSKSISKVGWIPEEEKVTGTLAAIISYTKLSREVEAMVKSRMACRKSDVVEFTNNPRKVRVTLTLTVEDVK